MLSRGAGYQNGTWSPRIRIPDWAYRLDLTKSLAGEALSTSCTLKARTEQVPSVPFEV